MESNTHIEDLNIDDSFKEIKCIVCGKNIGLIEISRDTTSKGDSIFSCTDCRDTFKSQHSLSCFLCGNKILSGYQIIDGWPVCHNHSNSKKEVEKKIEEQEYEEFVKKKGSHLQCSYCDEIFYVTNNSELNNALCARSRMYSHWPITYGPFSCPKCQELFRDNKIKICIQCGKEMDQNNSEQICSQEFRNNLSAT